MRLLFSLLLKNSIVERCDFLFRISLQRETGQKTFFENIRRIYKNYNRAVPSRCFIFSLVRRAS